MDEVELDLRNDKVLVEISRSGPDSSRLSDIKVIVSVIHEEREIDSLDLERDVRVHDLTKLDDRRVPQRICVGVGLVLPLVLSISVSGHGALREHDVTLLVEVSVVPGNSIRDSGYVEGQAVLLRSVVRQVPLGTKVVAVVVSLSPGVVVVQKRVGTLHVDIRSDVVPVRGVVMVEVLRAVILVRIGHMYVEYQSGVLERHRNTLVETVGLIEVHPCVICEDRPLPGVMIGLPLGVVRLVLLHLLLVDFHLLLVNFQSSFVFRIGLVVVLVGMRRTGWSWRLDGFVRGPALVVVAPFVGIDADVLSVRVRHDVDRLGGRVSVFVLRRDLPLECRGIHLGRIEDVDVDRLLGIQVDLDAQGDDRGVLFVRLRVLNIIEKIDAEIDDLGVGLVNVSVEIENQSILVVMERQVSAL